MITLSKLMELSGVSRRVLQDYNKLGLLPYRSQTPGGYWLYADNDVERLAVIQLLRHSGCSRQEILQAMNNPDEPFATLSERAQRLLQEKRSQIDSALEQLRQMQTSAIDEAAAH